MKAFLNEDFFLSNEPAKALYFGYAESLPVVDFHCHLDPADIANDRKFGNLTRAWLDGDHYKWRAMRANGIEEKYITGSASDEQKFDKWAETVPKTLRNPLYIWSHLELRRYFNCESLLNPENSKQIYAETGELLGSNQFSCRNLLKKMNVEVICTTDDPTDSLEYHKALKKIDTGFRVFPTFRPDRAMAGEDPEMYNQYINKLGSSADMEIGSFEDLIRALKKRHDYFLEHGCRISDHGLEAFFSEDYSREKAESSFARLRAGKQPDARSIEQFNLTLLTELAWMDHDSGWIQQYHYGAIRNNNSRMHATLGPDSGFDSIGSGADPRVLAAFFDRLFQSKKLAKTVIYNLNPNDNEMLAAMLGNFQDGSTPGKMQFGPAWWFLDQKSGIEDQLNSLSNMGLLSHFIGMLTDSRSFLSFPRHEYFRRILCNLLGSDIENGLIPNDIEWVGGMVSDICYHNAKKYFNF